MQTTAMIAELVRDGDMGRKRGLWRENVTRDTSVTCDELLSGLCHCHHSWIIVGKLKMCKHSNNCAEEITVITAWLLSHSSHHGIFMFQVRGRVMESSNSKYFEALSHWLRGKISPDRVSSTDPKLFVQKELHRLFFISIWLLPKKKLPQQPSNMTGRKYHNSKEIQILLGQ